MAVEPTQSNEKKFTPLPPMDPDLMHVVHMGPDWDRLLRLRPEDLLKPRKTKPKPTR